MAKKQERRERKRGVRREGRHQAEAKQHQRGGDFVCFTPPDGVNLFKPEKDKTYHIDILPYITGKHNKACKPGDEFYTLTYPVYRGLGIEEKPYIAIGELLGVRDPVTEHFAALRKSGAEWDEMKAFRATERQMWLVFVHEQADKGLQLYDAAYGTLGKLLMEEIEDAGEVTWVDNFDDPAGGATLKIRFKAEQVMTNTWVKAAKITFLEREDGFTADGDKKLAEKILDQVAEICLDDLLKIPTYEILKAALDGVPAGSEEEEEDEAPKGRRDRKDKAPEPDDDEEDDPPAKPAKGKKPKPPEDDEEEEEEEPPFDDEEEEDDPPAKPAKKARKQPTAADLGIERGGIVTHDEYGECTVLKVASDGLTVSIRDADGDIHRDIDPADLEPAEEEEEPEEKPAPKKAAKKTKATEPDDDEEDDPPAKPAKGKKEKAKSTKDDDWDENWEDED